MKKFFLGLLKRRKNQRADRPTISVSQVIGNAITMMATKQDGQIKIIST